MADHPGRAVTSQCGRRRNRLRDAAAIGGGSRSERLTSRPIVLDPRAPSLPSPSRRWRMLGHARGLTNRREPRRSSLTPPPPTASLHQSPSRSDTPRSCNTFWRRDDSAPKVRTTARRALVTSTWQARQGIARRGRLHPAAQLVKLKNKPKTEIKGRVSYRLAGTNARRVLGRNTNAEKRMCRYTCSMDAPGLLGSNGPWHDVPPAAALSRRRM